MLATMYAASGIGLAAPQVRVLQRVIVFYLPPTRDDVNGTGVPLVSLTIVSCYPFWRYALLPVNTDVPFKNTGSPVILPPSPFIYAQGTLLMPATDGPDQSGHDRPRRHSG